VPLALRPLTTADFAAVDALLSAAYARSSSMLGDLARYHRHQPDGWYLATLDGVPVGMGGAIVYGPVGRIGLMAVHPDFQRRGIGQAVMGQLLDWIALRGGTIVRLDATPAGVPLYRRLGFVTEDYAQAMVQARYIAPTSRETGMVEPLLRRDLPEVVAFDAERFGASRAAILAGYCDEFANGAFVARNSTGTVAGYLIVQTQRLGPWLADTMEVAESLLRRALYRSPPEPLSALVPECNGEARALLERYGFTPGRRWHAMRRGEASAFPQRERLYGYANFYFG
jgi:ribosomal protein S18 acetylase RimI-like enzyme